MEFHWYYPVAYAIIGFMFAVSNGWFEFIEDPGEHPGLFFAGLFWPLAIPVLGGIHAHQFLAEKKASRKLRIALEEKIRIAQEKEIERILFEEDELDKRNRAISAR